MPKGWEQYDDSPVMLKPPTSTVVEQVPDSWDHQMLLLVQGFRSSCLSFRESFIHNSGSFLHAENHPHVPVCCCPGEDWRDGAHAALTLRKNKLYHHGGTALVTWLCDDGWRTLYALTYAAPSHCPWYSRSWPSSKGQRQTHGNVNRRQWPFRSWCSHGRRVEEGPRHRVSDANRYRREWTG